MKSFIIILYIAFISSQAWATYIGVENNFRHIGKIQTDADGGTNFLEFSPGVFIATSTPAPLLTNTWMYPGAAIFFPERSGDDLYTKWYAELNFHLLTPLTASFDFIYGATYLMNLIVGAGGTSVQNNGNSSSTYYVPSESRFTGGFVPEIGMRYEFWRAKYFYFGILGHQLLDEDARSFTLTFNFQTWI